MRPEINHLDELSSEIFVCYNCNKSFDITQVSWPKITKQGKFRVLFEKVDGEDSYLGEALCYDCISSLWPDMECDK